MNLLHIVPTLNPAEGGVVAFVRTLAPSLVVLTPAHILTLDNFGNKFAVVPSCECHALGPGMTSWGYSSSFRAWISVRLSEFDAVICHGLWQYPLVAVRREIERLRKAGSAPKFYIYPHGMLDPWFQRDPSRFIKSIRNKIYWRLLERHNLNSADAVLFTCEEERRLAATTFPGYLVTAKVVGYGISSPPALTTAMQEAFSQVVPDSLGDHPYFLFLSRIHPKKGVDLLMRAYVRLVEQKRDELTEVPFPTLVIAGPLDSEYANGMKELAAELVNNTRCKIVFTGMLEGDAKWGAIYGADSFILPSHQENFGIAVVEALACGTPVLISDKVNIWKEIIDGGGGLVTSDDEVGVYELMERWFALSSLSKRTMANDAFEVYNKHFAIAPAAQRLAEFLKSNYSDR